MKPKRILFLSPTAHIGGAENSLIRLINFLKESTEFEPFVILPKKGKLNNLLKESTQIINLPKWVIEAHSVLGLFISSIIINFIVLRFKINIIHANSKFCSRLAIWSGVLSRKKIILHWRDFSLWPDEKRYLNWFAKKIQIIAVSNSVKQFLIDHQIKATKIDVLYDAIDQKYLQTINDSIKKNLKEKYEINNELVLAITGRIDSWKGHKLLLTALGKLPELKYKLLIAGDYHKTNNPNIEEELQKIIKKYQLTNKVKFIGFRNDLEQILSIVDIVIIPSDFEPLGMVALEAMATGTAVLASNTGGLSETVKDNETGFLFNPKDIQDLKKKLIYVYENRLKLQRIGEKGKVRYNKVFSENVIKVNYFDIILNK